MGLKLESAPYLGPGELGSLGLTKMRPAFGVMRDFGILAIRGVRIFALQVGPNISGSDLVCEEGSYVSGLISAPPEFS